MERLAIGDQVKVTSLIPNHEDDPRNAYYAGEIVWFSGSERVGVRCASLGHTIHVVGHERLSQNEE